MKTVSVLFLGWGLTTILPLARACGPDFPNSYLSNSVEDLTRLPSLDFASELERLLPAPAVPPVPSDAAAAEAAERAEVRQALLGAGVPPAEADRALEHYDRHHPDPRLPREFALYARGANAWLAGEPAAAIRGWRDLLALPEADRPYRTVWAAYMLGRALYVAQPNEARGYFRLARDAAARGLPDTQQLARASLGWEARSYLVSADYVPALHLYLQQFQAGDASALPSLQRAVRLAFVGEPMASTDGGLSAQEIAAAQEKETYFVARPSQDLRALAADRQVRGLVTAWFVSMGGPHSMWGAGETALFQRWLEAVRQQKNLDAEEAERWAFAAYQSGRWEEARRFAERAPREGAMAEWVRSMLLLRSGAVDAAAGHLTNAARRFPRDYPAQDDDSTAVDEAPWRCLAGVQGTLALRRDQFAEALQIFLESDHWEDAAFVAERILTLDELVVFVQGLPPEPQAPAVAASGRVRTPAEDLRYLLARRLARAHRFDAARAYYPREFRPDYDAYVAACRKGFDPARPAADRADAFWAAAQEVHDKGMELLGTELEPDYAIWDGNFTYPGVGAFRYANVEFGWDHEPYRRPEANPSLGVLTPTADEFKRVYSHLPPVQRFHYRARAAELAWLAAGLLPNDDDRTAEILDTAGRWLAGRAPEEANLFYRSLVVRCPHTVRGQKAQSARWFGREPAGN